MTIHSEVYHVSARCGHREDVPQPAHSPRPVCSYESGRPRMPTEFPWLAMHTGTLSSLQQMAVVWVTQQKHSTRNQGKELV